MVDFSMFNFRLGMSESDVLAQKAKLLESGNLSAAQKSILEGLDEGAAKKLLSALAVQSTTKTDETSLVEVDINDEDIEATKKDAEVDPKKQIKKEDFLTMDLPDLDDIDREGLFDELAKDRGFITQEDIDNLTLEVVAKHRKNKDIKETPEELANVMTPPSQESATQGPPSPGSPRNYGTSGSSSGDQTATGQQDEKALDNMSKDQLNAELTTANSALADKKSKLDGILNGSDPELTSLKQTMDDALKAYQDQLKEVDVEMAEQLQTLQNSISTKEAEISAKEGEIVTQEGVVSNAKTAHSNAVSTRESLEAALSSLESSSGSDEDDTKKAERSSKISALKGKIDDAKKAEDDAKKALDEAEAKLAELNTQKETLTGELTTLQGDMTKLEAEIAKAHPEIQANLDAYNNAKQTYDSQKTTAASTAKTELQEVQAYIDKIQTAINNCDNKQNVREYGVTGLTNKHMFQGAEYDVVGINGYNSLQEFVDDMQAKGIMNKGPYGAMQCFNYSQAYGAIMMNDPTVDASGNAASNLRFKEWNKRPFMQMSNGSEQEALNMMKSQLDDGKPVVIQVKSDGMHYALAVGYKPSADGVVRESDFLIIDSYDARIKHLGSGSGPSRQLRGWKGSIWVYTPGYSYGRN